MIYFVIAGFIVSFFTLFLVIGLAGPILEIKRIGLSSLQGVKGIADAEASFMEYVAAFQGEDMIFNKELRERGSAHLSELAETLREDLGTV